MAVVWTRRQRFQLADCYYALDLYACHVSGIFSGTRNIFIAHISTL
jgi:hypothetical protein